MSDLICYIPNHGYAEDTALYISWLDGTYYVNDPDTNSFKLTNGASGANLSFSDTITSGYVRQISGSGTTTITGLGHLEGEYVYVVSGGSVVGSGTVSGGSITVTSEVTTYCVGKVYGAKLRTMRFAVPGGENLQTRIKRISEMSLRYVRTKNAQVGQEIDDIEYMQNMDIDFDTKSKDETVLVEGGFSEDGYAVIKSIEPYPMTVLATIVEVDISER